MRGAVLTAGLIGVCALALAGCGTAHKVRDAAKDAAHPEVNPVGMDRPEKEGVKGAVEAPFEDVNVDGAAVELLDRHRHVMWMDEQPVIRLGYIVRREQIVFGRCDISAEQAIQRWQVGSGWHGKEVTRWFGLTRLESCDPG